ncbi:MAG: lipopolysaccharide core heptose(II) kinase RfaY [Cetobacterium sp.]|uniref:lipopolysaccharide core heptose(II) kinase RfaY n=1 Tax=Cetobacterium sp. TaxID=2071632 RepID=UPI002FC80E56
MISSTEYRGYQIYYRITDRVDTLSLGKDIVNKKYNIIDRYKDTERNFVARVEIAGKQYVLKSPKAETVIPQRRVQTMFKKGEALNSLMNLSQYAKEGYNEFIVPRVVVVKRGMFIEESFILMDYIEGEILRTEEDIDSVVEIVKHIHSAGIYHGDLNTSNFIKTKDGIKIIDTQGKRENFWNFKRSYDILTLKRDLLVMSFNYPVDEKMETRKDSLGYMLAFMIKGFKQIPFVDKIRNLKRGLRNKGWKI